MTKQSFPIPEGCKAVTVEQVGNQIITTFEPIKKKRWRADYGCVYFYFNYDFVVSTTKEYKFNTDDICYNSGNYFRTKAQAQRAADRLKAELDKFWEEELR